MTCSYTRGYIAGMPKATQPITTVQAFNTITRTLEKLASDADRRRVLDALTHLYPGMIKVGEALRA